MDAVRDLLSQPSGLDAWSIDSACGEARAARRLTTEWSRRAQPLPWHHLAGARGSFVDVRRTSIDLKAKEVDHDQIR